jgi:serine-type D-Ala-D-Ala carboxypeptidase
MRKKLRAPFRSDDRRAAALLFAAMAVLSLIILVGAVRESPSRERNAAEVAVEDDPPPLGGAALQQARAVVTGELERRAFPGAALAIGNGSRVELVEAYGRIGWRDAAAAVTPHETMYDLGSVTKAVATTIAVLLLVEDGVIALDDPVQTHLPAFEGEWKERITWRHLLSHTSGLPGGAVIRGDSPEERARRLLRTRTLGPGHLMTYTDLGYLVLWEAAERVAGEPLDSFLERRVWRPLGMTATVFAPGQDCEACAPTLRLSTGTPFRGQPSDLLARRLGGVTGNAGLFSTARDMSRFAAMIAGGGALNGVRILRPETVRELFRQQQGAGRRTLGWTAFCPDEAPDPREPCRAPVAYGHTGWPGTSLWMAPGGGPWVVLLTNRSYDVRAEPRMDWLRAALFGTVTGSAIVPELAPDADAIVSSTDGG